MGLGDLDRMEVVSNYLRERALFHIRERSEGKGWVTLWRHITILDA